MVDEKAIQNIFAGIAPSYDRMNRLISWNLVNGWRRAFLEQAGPGRGEKILDVCTGSGELALLFAQRAGPAGQVVGLDFSSAMLAVAEEKIKGYQKNGVFYPLTLVQGNALALPFAANTFDCVTSGFALRNLSDLGRAVREMVRVCKTGGRVLCLEISEPASALLKAGFDLYFHHLIPLLGAPYAWLSKSLRRFPAGEELTRIFSDAGLQEVKVYPLTGGIVTMYKGTKK